VCCPLCYQRGEPATNIGFFECKATIEGTRSNDEVYEKDFVADDNLYYTFKQGGPENIVSWQYIHANVEPIGAK